jgi:hypothetical protein
VVNHLQNVDLKMVANELVQVVENPIAVKDPIEVPKQNCLQ